MQLSGCSGARQHEALGRLAYTRERHRTNDDSIGDAAAAGLVRHSGKRSNKCCSHRPVAGCIDVAFHIQETAHRAVATALTAWLNPLRADAHRHQDIQEWRLNFQNAWAHLVDKVEKDFVL